MTAASKWPVLGSVRLNLQDVKTPMAGILMPSVHTTRRGRLAARVANRPTDSDEAVGDFIQVAVLRIKEHMVQVSTLKRHAARHVVEGKTELGYLGSCCPMTRTADVRYGS